MRKFASTWTSNLLSVGCLDIKTFFSFSVVALTMASQSALQEASTCEAAEHPQTQRASMREAHPAEGRIMLGGRGGRRPQPRASRGSAESSKDRQNWKRMRSRRVKRGLIFSGFVGTARSCFCGAATYLEQSQFHRGLATLRNDLGLLHSQ